MRPEQYDAQKTLLSRLTSVPEPYGVTRMRGDVANGCSTVESGACRGDESWVESRLVERLSENRLGLALLDCALRKYQRRGHPCVA